MQIRVKGHCALGAVGIIVDSEHAALEKVDELEQAGLDPAVEVASGEIVSPSSLRAAAETSRTASTEAEIACESDSPSKS